MEKSKALLCSLRNVKMTKLLVFEILAQTALFVGKFWTIQEITLCF